MQSSMHQVVAGWAVIAFVGMAVAFLFWRLLAGVTRQGWARLFRRGIQKAVALEGTRSRVPLASQGLSYWKALGASDDDAFLAKLVQVKGREFFVIIAEPKTMTIKTYNANREKTVQRHRAEGVFLAEGEEIDAREFRELYVPAYVAHIAHPVLTTPAISARADVSDPTLRTQQVPAVRQILNKP